MGLGFQILNHHTIIHIKLMRTCEILTSQTDPRKMAKSIFSYCILFLLYYFLPLRSSAINIPYSTHFDRCFFKIFGVENIKSLHNGTVAEISLDPKSRAGLVSSDIFFHGYFSASIKLPRNRYTAGVVVSLFVWFRRTSTAIPPPEAKSGSTVLSLVRPSTADFHKYSILRTKNNIIFYIDNVSIRLFIRTKSIGNYYITTPMYL